MFTSIMATLASLSALSSLTVALDSTRVVHQFPNHTWIENIAVRSNGFILAAEIVPHGILHMIDPSQAKPKATAVHRFPKGLITAGITETTPDNFYVIVSDGSLETLNATDNRIYNVQFPSDNGPASVSELVHLTDAQFLNGLTTLNETTILAADSRKGVVWAIDTTTGVPSILLNDPLMAASTKKEPFIGVNGLKIRGNTLYFTNSVKQLFARMQINPDGTAASAAVPMAKTPGKNNYDDFALGRCQDAFLTTGGGNTITRVGRQGKQRRIAGAYHSTEIAEPTSAAFGRTEADANILYVATGGGLGIPVNGDEVIGGQIVAVDVTEENC